MAETEIHRVTLGSCNCYLIKEEGMIMVDAGPPNRVRNFLHYLTEKSIDPRDIYLILLTHANYDHIGSTNEIKQLTDSKIATNKRERKWVEHPPEPFSPGVNAWGKIGGLVGKMMLLFIRFPGTPVDIVLEDEVFSLRYPG